jgi:hypothetical protein
MALSDGEEGAEGEEDEGWASLAGEMHAHRPAREKGTAHHSVGRRIHTTLMESLRCSPPRRCCIGGEQTVDAVTARSTRWALDRGLARHDAVFASFFDGPTDTYMSLGCRGLDPGIG